MICYLYQPQARSAPRPTILLHGMGMRTLRPILPFARRLARAGVPTLCPALPCHHERAPQGSRAGQQILHDNIQDTLRDYRQAVVDVRTGADLLQQQGIARDGLVALGISFGGMIATIASGMDQRFQGLVPVAAAGNMPRILSRPPSIRGTKPPKPGPEERPSLNRYLSYIRSLDSPADLHRHPPPTPLCYIDPLTFARFHRDRKVVVYHAGLDCVLPPTACRELWEDLGRPEQHHLICGHNTIVLFCNAIVRRTARLAHSGVRER